MKIKMLEKAVIVDKYREVKKGDILVVGRKFGKELVEDEVAVEIVKPPKKSRSKVKKSKEVS